MTYDDKVPSSLKKTQQWFGSIIGRPIDMDNAINPIAPSGIPIEIEAAKYIVPSPTLKPAQRIQIYNQQYWWRLLNTLHESFPFLTRLTGYQRFNQTIGFPYLVQHPPRHWSLSLLGDCISQWLQDSYEGSDKLLLVDAAKLDWAFGHCFLAPQFKSLDSGMLRTEGDLEAMLGEKLFTQSHLHLLVFGADLFSYRVELLKHSPEHWHEHGLPTFDCDRTYYFVLFRNHGNNLEWREVAFGEYQLLKLFQQGISIEKACEWLESQEEELYHEAMENLQQWFHEWTRLNWLTVETQVATYIAREHCRI
jgi:hypothetical protein